MKLKFGAFSLTPFIVAIALVGLQACGGGGGDNLAAPSVSDPAAQSYTEATAITTLSFNNTGGGSLTSCTASPALPDGLSVSVSSNSSTCEISGTPTTEQAAADYTITATNSAGSSAATVSITVTVIADQNANGYFTGTASVKQAGDNTVDFSISDLQVMINGTRIMMMSHSQEIQYDGTFTITGNDLESTVTIYHNRVNVGTAVLNAVVSEGSQITGTLTGTELGNGTFESTYSLLSDTDSSLSQVSPVYWMVDTINTFEFGLLDNTIGTISHSTPADDSIFSCLISSGSTAAPIANSSLFAITIVFGPCNNTDVEGTYTGFAQSKTANTSTLIVSNGTYAFGYDFINNN